MKYIDMLLPVAVFSNYIAIFVRADGDPNRAMAGVLFGEAVNIVLDIIFVFPCNIGIGGAALCFRALEWSFRSRSGPHISSAEKNGLKFINPKHIISSVGQIIENGISSFFNELANGFIVLLFNVQILKYLRRIRTVGLQRDLKLCYPGELPVYGRRADYPADNFDKLRCREVGKNKGNQANVLSYYYNYGRGIFAERNNVPTWDMRSFYGSRREY